MAINIRRSWGEAPGGNQQFEPLHIRPSWNMPAIGEPESNAWTFPMSDVRFSWDPFEQSAMENTRRKRSWKDYLMALYAQGGRRARRA